MDLNSLILPSKTVEFQYEGVKGLYFSLAYVSKSELTKIRKNNTKRKRNKTTKEFEDVFDDEGFLKEYIPSVLKDWRGLTIDTAQNFLIMEEQDDMSKEIEYTEENAYALLTNSEDLDIWVSVNIGDIENFRTSKSKEKETS